MNCRKPCAKCSQPNWGSAASSTPLHRNWFRQHLSHPAQLPLPMGRRVVMPIIELANYGPGTQYDTERGVSLHGTFEGEVLVRYTIPADPYDLFVHWMFAPEEPMAFSIKMNL